MGDETSWVFDSLVGFLRGPVWNLPILTFIENKSLIFEPACAVDEDHTRIHDEYKNLVDFMLGSYMEDIGIPPEQFESECGKASSNIKDKIHQTLFEQVWAADDYEIFQRMMIQKNLELQLQALALLQKKYGIVPESFTSDGDLSMNEKTVMEEVIKKSLDDHQEQINMMDQEEQEMEKAIALSQEDNKILEEKIQREKELMMEAVTKTPEERDAPSAPVKSTQLTIDPEELNKRQKYLREQRDKLLALKRKEREKQLNTYEQSAPQARPKSSRAARNAIKGNVDPKILLVRKALVERFKAEVIDQ